MIDLRTILPLDVKTVAESVAKTHRLLIVDEGWAMCGVGAELGQAMNEIAFDELDAPVGRLHTEPVSHPLAPSLERMMLVDAAKIVAAAKEVMAGRAPVPWHWRYPGLAAAAPAAASATAPAPAANTNMPVAASTAEALKAAVQAATGGEPITMPFGDLTVSEGTIVRWVKAEGEMVKAGDLVAEIETDKAVVEIEAPSAGKLAIELREGTVVPMGGRIGAVH